MTRTEELAANLAAVEERVAAACAAAGRARDEVRLVAVSKTWPASDVAALRDLGVTDFGENRDGEAAEKVAAVTGVRWHFVGAVQTNKARSVTSYADVVHSVDRTGLVDALSRGAVRADRTVDVLVQVSLDGDPSRGGALAADVPALADEAASADGLRLAGVMAVAPLGEDPAAAFARLAAVAERLRQTHPYATTVSAGMSGDLEAALEAGANALRVGTALFGHRAPLSR
ncbi:MAG: alanine racemase domain protein [Frankiales bacterium]|nr:alanine racemase domain protein [Frankiales bacterium]